MQVEIVHNLQKSLGWTEIASALRLTHHEERSVIAHCNYRNSQLETENRIIRDMHEEQLKDILMVDNLGPEKKRVPDRLALRKSTSRHMSDLMPRVSPDYLMCQPWELFKSRKYLRHAGLNPDLAGEWSGNMVTFQNKYGMEKEAIPWRDTSEGNGVQDEEAVVETDEENTAWGELRPQMGFLNGVGVKDGPGPSFQQQPQQSEPPSECHLNAAQQIFNRQYSKPTHQERSIARARARAHIRGPDQAESAMQLSVSRHRAAEIRGNPLLSPHVPPTGDNQEQPPPPQSERSVSVDNPREADRQTRAASVPQARVQSPLPTNHSVRGNSVGLMNNPNVPTPANVNQRGTERALQRNLGGSWSYGLRGSEAEQTPCPPARFREGMASAPAQGTPQSTLSTENRVSQQHDSFTLPIRTSPRSVSNSGSSQPHAPKGNERKEFGPATPKQRKVRVSMDGSPILSGSSADRATPEISDPPGFNGNHEQRLVSSPTTSQTPGYKPTTPKDCEYPSPPTLRKNPRCLFDSAALDSKEPQTELKRRSLLQAFSQSRVDSSLGSTMTVQTEVSTGTNQCNQEPGVGTGAFPSNLDPQLFDPPNQVAEQETNVSNGEPNPNHEVPQTHESSAIDIGQQVTETQDSIIKQVEAKVGDGESEPGLQDAADAMDIDTEEPSQPQNAVLSQSTMSSTADTILEENTTLSDSRAPGTRDTTVEGDTTLSDSRESGTGDTTIEEGDTTLSDSRVTSLGDTTLEEGDTTLSSSKATDLEEPSGNPQPSNNKKSRARAGTKTGKAKAEVASKPATRATTKETTKAAAKKKKEKPKEAGARTQPRRTAKNGPEPTRELRPRKTKTE